MEIVEPGQPRIGKRARGMQGRTQEETLGGSFEVCVDIRLADIHVAMHNSIDGKSRSTLFTPSFGNVFSVRDNGGETGYAAGRQISLLMCPCTKSDNTSTSRAESLRSHGQ